MIKKFIHQFASPKTYIYQVDRAYSYIFYISLVLYLVSIFWGLFLTPEDFVQGNSYRIIYLHVPASFISQSLYIAMAIASAIFLIWKVKLSVYLVRSIAPIGAITTFIALNFRLYMGHTYMGDLVGLGCKNCFNVNIIYYVSRLNFFT